MTTGRARWPVVVGALVAAVLASASARATSDRFPGSARAYVVRADGATLWATAAHARVAPASLTKVMTALLVIDAVQREDTVTVSARAARARGARLGLAAGSRAAAGDLLVAMLLRSANDACVALAEHVAGNEADFVARMNARGHAMGLADTRFANACGFDAPGHHSSAEDLARLGEAFAADARLAAIAAQPAADIRTRDGRTYTFANTNALIGRVPGAVGVKTGYTARAGHCLIGLVERDGRRVLVVLLGARDRWWDAVAMIEQAFASSGRAAPTSARR